MDHRLHPRRLKLADEDVAALADRWARWRQAPRRHLDLPDDLTHHLSRLATHSRGAAPVWLEAMLLMDLHGRLWLESCCPLSDWFVAGEALHRPTHTPWTVPQAWVEDLRATEALEDDRLGLAVRQRLLRQLLGHESPDDLNRVVDTAWQVDDTSLTVWLPERAGADAKAFAEHLDFTVSDVLRNTLFMHLWGRAGYAECLADGRWRQKRRDADALEIKASVPRIRVPEAEEVQPDDSESATSFTNEEEPPRRVARIAEHGKSATAHKVWLPTAMKNRLVFWAQDAGLRTSDHCRDAVLQALYGHRASKPDPR